MEVNILPEITSSLVSVQNILSITVLDLGLARVYDIMCGNSEVAYIWSRKSAVSVLFSYLSKLALKSLIRMMCLFFLFISFFVNIGHEMIIKFFKFYARMTVNAATNHLFMFWVTYFNKNWFYFFTFKIFEVVSQLPNFLIFIYIQECSSICPISRAMLYAVIWRLMVITFFLSQFFLSVISITSNLT